MVPINNEYIWPKHRLLALLLRPHALHYANRCFIWCMGTVSIEWKVNANRNTIQHPGSTRTMGWSVWGKPQWVSNKIYWNYLVIMSHACFSHASNILPVLVAFTTVLQSAWTNIDCLLNGADSVWNCVLNNSPIQ